MQRLPLKCILLFASAFIVTRCHVGHDHSNSITPDQRPTNFNDPKFTQDQAHLKEHLKNEINMNAKMTPDEMEFHYFRLHDTNNDTYLDGLEILQAVAHMMPVPELQVHEKLGKSKEQVDEIMQERHKGMQKYYEEMIDRVFAVDDLNKDGYLTYAEFVRARRREEFNVRRMQEFQMRQQQSQVEQFQQFQAMQAQMQSSQGQVRPTIPPPSSQSSQQGQQQQQLNQQQGQQQGQQQYNQQHYQQPR